MALLHDELLVQALAVAKVSATVTAAVPHRMALALVPFAFIAFELRFTCSYFLIKELLPLLSLGLFMQPPNAAAGISERPLGRSH